MNVFEGWRITSKYGERIHPVDKVKSFHTGIDLSKYDKCPIPAFIEGKVLYVGDGGKRTGYGSAFGNIVVLRDPTGHIHLYAHLYSFDVKIGQDVKCGQVIGKQGNTGKSTASHLHYEIRTSEVWRTDVEPTKYLEDYFKREQELLAQEELLKMILQFTSYEKSKLVECINDLHKLGFIDSPKLWIDKINGGKATVSEFAFLNTVLLTRLAHK